MLAMFFLLLWNIMIICFFFFFQAEDGIRDVAVTGVQTVLFRSRPRPPEKERTICRESGDTDTTLAGEGARTTRRNDRPGRRTHLPRLRLDHGKKRQLLQVHELRKYQRVLVGLG